MVAVGTYDARQLLYLTRQVRSERLISPEMLRQAQQFWTRDQRWARGARLVDMRQPIICGGGGCNPPYGNSQFWAIDSVPCTPSALSEVLFQVDRYGVAQGQLRALLASAPGPIPVATQRELPGTSNPQSILLDYKLEDARRIQAQAAQWARWTVNVYRAVAVAQWASNVRWWMVRNYNKQVFPGSRGGLRFWSSAEVDQFPRRVVEDPLVGLSVSLNVIGLDQMGDDGKWDVTNNSRAGSGANILPPIIQTRVPVSGDDFDPTFLFYESERDRLPLRATAGWGEDIRPMKWPKRWGAFPTGSIVEKLTRVFEHAPDWIGDMVQFYNLGRSGPTFQYLPAEQVPPGVPPVSQHAIWEPYCQLVSIVAHAGSLAREIVDTGFGTALERSTQAFQKFYEKLPPDMQALSVSDFADVMRTLTQAQLNAAAEAYSIGAGVVTSVVAAINPIAGVVVGLVASIIGLLIRFAQDVGLTRSDNPPCPPAPYLRLIPATATTAACDYDLTRDVPVGTIAAKVSTIGRMAAAGIRPDQWFDALDALERTQPPRFDPQRNQNVSATRAVAALAGGAAGLALTKYLLMGKVL